MGKLAPGRFRDVIPTDFKFMEGNATKVDRSSLTGESLSVIQSEGDEGYSGSGLKQGEIEAVMTSTGLNTFLGHAAEKIVFCMVSIGFWCVVKLVVRLAGCAAQNLLAKENAIVARLTYSEEMIGMLYAALSACTENIEVTDVMYHPTSTRINTPAYNSPGECKRKVTIFKDVNQKTPDFVRLNLDKYKSKS
ncbi:hypothetical protein JG688_00017425, partial [Phytophthora aleatoria]